MTRSFLPYGKQEIGDDDVAAVAAVLRGDWLTTGPTVEAFETALAEKVGAQFAVVCSSGTAALHLAVLAAGIGPGDAAVVPSITFLATANAIRYVGGDVVFADVDSATGLMTPATLESALARSAGNIKAVLPVHLAGQTIDLEAVSAIAKRAGAIVIEDACHALGTTLTNGGVVGDCRYSAMTVFSFHPVKTIAMGEGGAITTNDLVLYERLLRLRNHGMTRVPSQFSNADLAFDADGKPHPWYYEMPEVGFNYRASDIHCALGLSQIRKLDGFIARRRELASLYDDLLKPLVPHILPPLRTGLSDPAWHLYAVRIDFAGLGISRELLVQQLRNEGIGTQVHYVPVHMQPYYQDTVGLLQLPGAMTYYRSTLSLPLFPAMTSDDVKRVVSALDRAVSQVAPKL